MFFTVTFAPETTAPEGSVTVPKIVPRKVCATSAPTARTTKARTILTLIFVLLSYSLTEKTPPKDDVSALGAI